MKPLPFNLDALLQDLLLRQSHYRRLWAYYRNPMRVLAPDASDQGSTRPYRQAQEWGLPSRLTGARSGCDLDSTPTPTAVARKEIVIENDIGWRIDTTVDYLFGKPLVIQSAATDPDRRQFISDLLRLILANHGGIQFLQQLALLGAVHGFVEVLVKFHPAGGTGGAAGSSNCPIESTTPAQSNCADVQSLGQPPVTPSSRPDGPTPSEGSADASPRTLPPHLAKPASSPDDSSSTGATASSREALLQRLSRMVRLEIIEPARALPVFSSTDSRDLLAYAQFHPLPAPQKQKRSFLDRFRPLSPITPAIALELITPTQWHRYHEGRPVAQGDNTLGRIPLVHVQNVAVPFEYAGASEVEPLIPLQDELNTRLSDRANRITFQSFKMYLGKGIETFNEHPVAPGRMWMTDNENADILTFGGDSNCPSEDAHMADLREAMDKISSVTPIAAGAIKNRIGRLTSAAALRITLLALLSRTEKKRTAYGTAIQQICELSLAWLDHAGLFATTPRERLIELHWPSPLPENDLEKLQEADAKLRLGIPREIILRELGY
jgi:hypothetical protein